MVFIGFVYLVNRLIYYSTVQRICQAYFSMFFHRFMRLKAESRKINKSKMEQVTLNMPKNDFSASLFRFAIQAKMCYNKNDNIQETLHKACT